MGLGAGLVHTGVCGKGRQLSGRGLKIRHPIHRRRLPGPLHRLLSIHVSLSWLDAVFG